MHKTSVYLNDDEVEGLRRAAAATGQSQADLIRAALRRMLADLEARPKVFAASDADAVAALRTAGGGPTTSTGV